MFLGIFHQQEILERTMSLVKNSNSHQEQSSMDYLLDYFPEPYRIRVVEPVKRTTEKEREKYLMEAGYNPFLLDSDKVFIDLLTDSGTGSVTQAMQSAMLRGDEAYSGSRSYYELSRAVKDIFGYQFTIPTHQGRGAEQLYVPALINKRERESGLDRDKMTAISNYFFDTTQGHTQHNRCRVLNVSTPEAFNTKVAPSGRIVVTVKN